MEFQGATDLTVSVSIKLEEKACSAQGIADSPLFTLKYHRKRIGGWGWRRTWKKPRLRQ
jgi:hypothetical protein